MPRKSKFTDEQINGGDVKVGDLDLRELLSFDPHGGISRSADSASCCSTSSRSVSYPHARRRGRALRSLD